MSPQKAALPRTKRTGAWLDPKLIILGAAMALGLAPFGWWWAAIPALGVFLWLAGRHARPAQAGFAAGVGYFAVGLAWIIEPFLVDIARHGWMAPFALILMAAGGAAFWAIPMGVAGRLTRGANSASGARIAALATALFLSDWLRGWIFTGFPWARLGQIWVDTPLAQSAALIGSLGLSALALTLAALAAYRPKSGTALALAIGFAIAGWGEGQLRRPPPPAQDTIIRLVQPDADQALKWDPYWAAEFYRRLLSLSEGEGPLGQPDLIVWPETAVNFVLEWQPEELDRIAAAAHGATTITGIQRADNGRYYNALIAIGPGGQLQAIYDKAHLTPFGEYIPLGDQLARIGITAFAAQAGAGYTPGPGMAVLTLPGMPAMQPLICYEAIFPHHLREATMRPEWLVQITNDAWFGTWSGPWQHLDQARLRAIESGLPMIRVANTGISAVIDANGRVLARLDLGQQGRIDTHLPGAYAVTPWIRFGDWPLIIFALIILGLCAIWPASPIDARRSSA